MYILVCAFCHLDFESRQPTSKYCKREHFMDCPVCGVSIKVKQAKRPPRTCSAACNAKLELSTGEPNHTCELCGIEYFSKNPRSRFCGNEHKSNCVVCGDSFVIVNNHKPATTCSKKCASSIVDYDEVGAKYRATVQERYGVDNVSQAPSIKEKKRKTAQKRYGVDNVSQAPEVQEKRNKTMNDMYGGYGASSPILKGRMVRTVRKKYGVDNVFQNDSIKAKARETFLNKYGVPHKGLIGKFDNPKKCSEWENLEEWLRGFSQPVTSTEIAEYFGVTTTSVNIRLRTGNIDTSLIDRNSSSIEKTFAKYLEENHPDVGYIADSRSVIAPKEVDFFFPDYNLAVELSPTGTHHSDKNHYNSFLSSRAKEKTYHFDKFNDAEENGIELMTYFDWTDWDKFCEMVSYKLSANSNTSIYARKCTVSLIPVSEASEFVQKNHILGTVKGSSFAYGLFYNGTLVGVAMFKTGERFKKSTGANKGTSERTVELLRMCFLKNHSVVGGASKLIKKVFNDEPSIDNIYTFSDNNLGLGSVYKEIGFTLESNNKPSCHWVNPTKTKSDGSLWSIKDLSLIMQGTDRILKNFPKYTPVGTVCEHSPVHENKECLPHRSVIMRDYGFLPVYDCGYKRWAFRR